TNPIGDLHRSENKMAGLLDRRDNSFMSQLKFMPNPTPRAPTPPQPESNEVDDAGSMDYRFEEVRLQSFENWPSEYVRPADLAAAGFYFTKQIDRVRCFECSTEICRWEQGDDPMVEHQRWGGRCRFIRKLPCGNVPIGADPSMIPAPRPRSRDVCGPYKLDYRLGAEADTHASCSGTRQGRQAMSEEPPKQPSAARLGSMGIGIPRRPDFPDYASYEARLLTFNDWPSSRVSQTKEQLADAGFFYTGTGDQTTCYHCGGGLKNWEPKDDPWVQHAKWFSTCFYVRLVKGQEFINNVNGKHATPLSEEDKMALPSCIKQVQQQPIKKLEQEDVPQQQNQQTEVNESTPGPSSVECPVPAPRMNAESQAQTSAASVPMVNGNASSSSVSEDKPQQPSEKKSIDDARVCKICYNEELGVVFLPCGHMVACVKCAPGMTTCAVCREPVAMTVRAFFS
ncbi:hypothetical protein TSAR_001649, partial [Trichomalopsis sarcophagae]